MSIGHYGDAYFASLFLAVIEKLRLFLAIIEEGSLRRAAERLHISQSAVTRQFCRRFGNFRPRFVSIGQANSLAELLVMSANEGAISLQPSFISHLSIPNVVMVPIAEKRATWDLSIV